MSDPDDKFIITRETMDNFNEWIVEAGRRKKILLDLIAELREFHQPGCDGEMSLTNYNYCQCGARELKIMPDGYPASLLAEYPCAQARVLDRAEARLREVVGDE